MARRNLCFALISFLLILNVSGVLSVTFTMINKCSQTVWPGILSSAGISPLDKTGFALQKDESRIVTVPTSWSGRLWGKFSCISGDCDSGKVECSGGGATPPATLAEFTLNGANGLDFYDVSLVGGTGGNCSTTGCVVNLNDLCPNDLKVTSEDGSHVACKSACEVFGDPQYCCSGAYGNPNTCKPSSYSEFFKNACPRAYSYAYDDGTSTFTCASASYVITFCPPLSTSKKATKYPEAAELPLYNSTMTYLGGGESLEDGGVSSSSAMRVSFVQFLGGAVSLFILLSSTTSSAIWRSI
ncbi:hypothetical protein MKW92_046056 [Papaver armeniacum]|nr:hypothetical protein MKW92_046056 [Papaver armeniacum]